MQNTTTQAPPRWWNGRKKAVAVLGVLTLLLIALETGTTGFAFGLALATLPVPVYLAVALWLDRFEAEPRRMLASAFFWGAAGAVFFSMLVNSFFELSLAASLGEEAAGLAGSVISAPVVEELTKALVLWVFFFRHRDEFDNVTDGIVYAAMVGLGFAMTENVLYYGNALAEGTDSSVATFVARGVLSPFAHPFFTAMTGIGLGIARETSRRWLRPLAPVLGFCAAMLLHAAWNLAASTEAFFLVYFLVMVPIFGGVILLVRRSLRREGRIIRAHLEPFVAAGLLPADELDPLCTVRGRLRASARTLWRGGYRAWRRHGELHQAVSELAFHRWRVERGITRGAELDAARERELAVRVGTLRDAVAR
ncbi:MAG TPA: PrsW family intramembrane metalloprotease [Longimicrobiaceae bacterium]|nr:PrsW family intramembrane metalloprotease [Longimicrobiaceae bacterium]